MIIKILNIINYRLHCVHLLFLTVRKIYVIPSNLLVAACFYANLVWNVSFGVDVFLEV